MLEIFKFSVFKISKKANNISVIDLFLCWHSFFWILPHQFRTNLTWIYRNLHELLWNLKSRKVLKTLRFIDIYENPWRNETSLAYYDAQFHVILILRYLLNFIFSCHRQFYHKATQKSLNSYDSIVRLKSKLWDLCIQFLYFLLRFLIIWQKRQRLK